MRAGATHQVPAVSIKRFAGKDSLLQSMWLSIVQLYPCDLFEIITITCAPKCSAFKTGLDSILHFLWDDLFLNWKKVAYGCYWLSVDLFLFLYISRWFIDDNEGKGFPLNPVLFYFHQVRKSERSALAVDRSGSRRRRNSKEEEEKERRNHNVRRGILFGAPLRFGQRMPGLRQATRRVHFSAIWVRNILV